MEAGARLKPREAFSQSAAILSVRRIRNPWPKIADQSLVTQASKSTNTTKISEKIIGDLSLVIRRHFSRQDEASVVKSAT
jgi:hypothetical protein